MENQKIINLLDKIDTDSKHFATKKWYIINDKHNTNYGVNKDTGENNPDTIKSCSFCCFFLVLLYFVVSRSQSLYLGG